MAFWVQKGFGYHLNREECEKILVLHIRSRPTERNGQSWTDIYLGKLELELIPLGASLEKL
jgi:hypothetical protein